jgi:hypothetical protein
MDLTNADQAGKRHHTLGDTVTILGLVVSLAAWALIPTLYARIAVLAVVVTSSGYLVHRSHFTRGWTTRRKHWVASVTVCFMVAISCVQLVPQWNREHRAKQNDTHVAASKQESPVASPKGSPAPSGPVKALRKRTPVIHAGHIHGDNNTTVGKTQFNSIEGSGNTIVGATDSAGNTVLNRGATTIGSGACGCPTCVVVGAHAGCGNNSLAPSDTAPKQP